MQALENQNCRIKNSLQDLSTRIGKSVNSFITYISSSLDAGKDSVPGKCCPLILRLTGGFTSLLVCWGNDHGFSQIASLWRLSMGFKQSPPAWLQHKTVRVCVPTHCFKSITLLRFGLRCCLHLTIKLIFESWQFWCNAVCMTTFKKKTQQPSRLGNVNDSFEFLLAGWILVMHLFWWEGLSKMSFGI